MSRVCVVILLALGSSGPMIGCGKTKDCNALATVTNRHGTEIANIEHRGSTSPQTLATDMGALAEAADAAAADVHNLELNDEVIVQQASRYEDFAHDLAGASRDFGGLMTTLEAQQSSRGDAAKTFDATGQALLDACATASSACNAVGDILRKQPANPSQAELAQILDDYVEALEDLQLQDSAVQTAIDARIAAAKVYRTAIGEGDSLQAQIEQARGKIHAVVARQNALIEQLNGVCVADK